MAEPSIHQVVVVPAPPEMVLHQLLSVSGADSYRPIMHSSQGLTLQRKKIPIWAIVVAIFLFPFGLVALLAKEENTVGIGLEPVQGGTQVTVSGQASSVLQSALQYVLSGQQATTAGLPGGGYVAAPAYGQAGYGQPGPQPAYGQPPPGGPPPGGPPPGGPPPGGPPPGPPGSQPPMPPQQQQPPGPGFPGYQPPPPPPPPPPVV